MKEKIKKLTKLDIIGIVLTIIFLPIIIINMTLVIKGMVNPSELPMVFNRAPLIVVSESMTIEKEIDSRHKNHRLWTPPKKDLHILLDNLPKKVYTKNNSSVDPDKI